MTDTSVGIARSLSEHAELRALHSILATHNGSLDQLLTRHLKPSCRKNGKTALLRYSLTVAHKSEHRADYDGLIHFDATHSLVLLYLGRPVANLSFIFREQNGQRSMRINQIQGVSLRNFDKLHDLPKVLGTDTTDVFNHKRVTKKGLARIDWETALVETAVLFAEWSKNIARVEIEPAQECDYFYSVCDIESADYFSDSQELVAQNERLKKRYDMTALRCGFALEKGIYTLKL
jgi:hypothetical protein